MRLSTLLFLGAVIALLVVTLMKSSENLIAHYGSFGTSTGLENSSTAPQPDSPQSTSQTFTTQSSRATKPSILTHQDATPGSVEVAAIPLQSLVPKAVRGLASLGIAGHGGQRAAIAHAWPSTGGPLLSVTSSADKALEAAPSSLYATRPHPS